MRDTLGDGGALRAATKEPHVDTTQEHKLTVTSVYKAPITVHDHEYTSRGKYLTTWEIYAPADLNKLGCQVSWQNGRDMWWNAFLRKFGIRSDMNQMARIAFEDLKKPSESSDGFYGYKITSESHRKCENGCYVWFNINICERASKWFDARITELETRTKQQARDELFENIIVDKTVVINGQEYTHLSNLVTLRPVYNGRITFKLSKSAQVINALKSIKNEEYDFKQTFSIKFQTDFNPIEWSIHNPRSPPPIQQLKIALLDALFPSSKLPPPQVSKMM